MSWLLPLLLALSRGVLATPAFVTGQSAGVVVGQANLTAAGVNGAPGVAASGLSLGASTTNGVWSDGTMLIVADPGNNRVKIYLTMPAGNGAPADVIVGQPDSASSLANQGGAAAANTLSNPTGVFYDGFFLYIADTGNNRVLIFQTLPQASNASADVVVGQSGFAGASANHGAAVAADGLNAPTGVYSDGTALFVADQGNHRVLSYALIPTANGAFASYVVGQSSFNVNALNQGGSVKNNTLSSPAGVWGDGARLYVADQNNNRALIFASTPAANNLAASYVIGQSSFNVNAANQGGSVTNKTLSSPRSVFSDGASVVVADASNNRVLIYAAIPSTNNVSADMVVGQTTFTANAANQSLSAPTAATLSRPTSAMAAAGSLFVTDQANNRGLIYNPVPTGKSYGAAAVIAVGQTDFVTATANQAVTIPAANTAFRPSSMQYDGTRLVVADRSNNRVLLFNTLPKANNASADVVVGQTLMSSGSANMGGAIGAATLNGPAYAFSDGTRLFVVDQFSSRVLIYNTIPAANGAAANVVIGQPNKTSGAANNGGLATNGAKVLQFPSAVHSDGTRVFVADRFNNRVLIWNAVPGADFAPANVVLGQLFFSSNVVNAGGLGASSLSQPAAVYSDGTRLYVADTNNNRVLMWNAIPAVNDKAADVVIGQPNFTSNAVNQGGAPTAKTLSRPGAVWADGAGGLYIADTGNNRVLVYKSTPSASNPAADFAIGQLGFTAGKANQGASPAATTLALPVAVTADSTTGRMFVADANNNRALEYLPASVSSVAASGGTLTFTSPIGPAQVVVSAPPLAFGQVTNMTFLAMSGFPPAVAPAAQLSGTGVGMELDLDTGLQPAQEVSLAVTYRPADLAGFDTSKLVLARYDPLTAAWLPLVSASDPVNRVVTAKTNHFSLFQLMQAGTVGNSVDSVVAFPNPLRPSSGQHAINFASAPPGARIRIYTLSGTLLKDLSADNNGMARWDATNDSGVSVASGVYFVYVQGGGRGAVLKVAIER